MSEYSWKQAQEDRGKQLNAYAAEIPAPPDDLVPRLLTHITEIEQLARQASPGPWKTSPEHDEVWAVDDIEVATGFALSNNQLRNTVDHIVLNADPESVLRLCQAHRQIVELHVPEEPWSGAGRLQCAHCAGLCHSETGLGCEVEGDALFPCKTLLILAAGLGLKEEQ